MNNAPEQLFAKLIINCKASGIEINMGIRVEEIGELEQEIDFCFENDFKSYLMRLNGFKDFDWDSNFFSLWSASRIREELNDFHPSSLVCFADYFINLCSFGFHRYDKKIYFNYQHREEITCVADSFAEFIQAYVDDSNNLLI